MTRKALRSVASRHFGVLFLLAVIAAGALLVTASGREAAPPAGNAGPAAAKLLVQGSTLFLPGAAHVTGAADTNWRTDLEVYNNGTVMAQYEVALLERDQANLQPATATFSLQPGRSVRYNDVLWTVFGFNGSAALRVSALSGAVMVSSRTYNQTAIGTYGQYIGGVLESRAIAFGQQGRIIQLTHNQSTTIGYRTNVGFVNTTSSPMVVRVDLFTSDGVLLGTRSYTVEAFMFTQKERIFASVTQGDVSDGYVVVWTETPGAGFFAYASVVDNRTGDPIYIPASVMGGSGQPTPTPTRTTTGTHPSTPTPTRTPTRTVTRTPSQTATQLGAQLNLRPYQPSGWDGPLVVSGQSGTHTSGGLVGGSPSYVDWAVINDGPDDVTFAVGTAIVELAVDGTARVSWVPQDSPYTLPAGYYVYVEDYQLDGVGAGAHTVTLTGDPDGMIPETNEGDNSYTYNGTWAGLKAGSAAPMKPRILGTDRLRAMPIPDQTADTLWGRPVDEYAQKRALGPHGRTGVRVGGTKLVGETVYIAATAHVAGAAGTNWRTDLELHNPGSTQGQYQIALLRRDENNASPATAVFSVPAQRCLRLQDVLFNVFSFTGGAALRITPLSGDVMVTSRTYNLTDQGTYGQFIGGKAESEAIDNGENGVVIQLSHQQGTASGYRTNLGFVSCVGSQVTVAADIYRSTGELLGTQSYTLPPYGYKQVDRIFQSVTQGEVADGYIVVRTTTPGGRFFAYASVVDNATGDPIFIPAAMRAGGGPPPTPTPTPTLGPAVPLDPLVVVQELFDWLATVGQGGSMDFEEAAAQIQTYGLQAALNQVPNELPGVVTVGQNSLQFDFPPGYVSPDGYEVSGLADVSFTSVNTNAPNLSADFSGGQQGLQINGGSVTIENASGSIDLATDAQGHVQGDVTFSGTGDIPFLKSASTIDGDVQVDTEICPNYPIGGQIVLQREEGRHEFNFDDSCDGTFVYIGPGQTGALAFRLRWQGPQDVDLYVREPNGEVIYYGNSTSSTGGQLDVDANSGCYEVAPDPTENIFWPEGMAPAGTYQFWADLWSDCGGSETPAVTLYVIRAGVIDRTINTSISGGQTATYDYQYP